MLPPILKCIRRSNNNEDFKISNVKLMPRRRRYHPVFYNAEAHFYFVDAQKAA
jgi:hypothetical protein